MKVGDVVTLLVSDSKKKREEVMKKYGLSENDVKALYRSLCGKKWRVMGEKEKRKRRRRRMRRNNGDKAMFLKRCPECGSVCIYKRVRAGGYKCRRCGAVFDKSRIETEGRCEDEETFTISPELKSKIRSWLGITEDAGADADTDADAGVNVHRKTRGKKREATQRGGVELCP